MFRKVGEIWECVPKKPESKWPAVGGGVVMILIALALLRGCNGQAAQDQTGSAPAANIQNAR